MDELEKIYAEIKNKYFSIKIVDVYKDAGVILIYWLLLICLVLFSIVLYISYGKEHFNNLALISSILFFIITYGIVQYTYKYFCKKYSKYKAFIKSEQYLWLGCRYILFLENIRDIDYSKKEIIDLLDSEIAIKKFDLTKSLHGLILIPSLLMLLNTFITKITKIEIIIATLIFFIVLYSFLYLTSTLYRSKVTRLRELKYFLLLKSEGKN